MKRYIRLKTESILKSKLLLCYDRLSVDQSALLSSPIWDPRPDFHYCQRVAGVFMWSALSNERMGLLKFLLGLASAVILGSESRGTHDHILLSQIRDSRNLEGQIPVFISPRHWIPFSSPPTTRR
jgi:hypothetical protein